MDALNVNTALLRQILVGFVRDEVTKVGVRKGVLGLSGGIDSALVAFIAAEALGPENVYAYCLPYRTSMSESCWTITINTTPNFLAMLRAA